MTTAAQFLARTAEATLSLIYPNACQICNVERATVDEGYVCAPCWRRPGAIKFIVEPYCKRCGLQFEGAITTAFECGNCREMKLHFEWARAAVAAEGLVREVIHRYKYHRAVWFEPFLANLLVRQAASTLATADWDWIVPVPLHPVRHREREFNQAERLAQHLAAATRIEVNARLLQRSVATHTQALLTRANRAENVRHAFSLCPKMDPGGKRIILLDDVLTTGATTNACAEVLRRAGATRVVVWTVARGL